MIEVTASPSPDDADGLLPPGTGATEPGSTVSKGDGVLPSSRLPSPRNSSEGPADDEGDDGDDGDDAGDDGEGDEPASSPPAARAVPVTPMTAAAPTAAAMAYERFMVFLLIRCASDRRKTRAFLDSGALPDR
ncbi:hypothetical protein [Paractinoplanes brasiliensis]|uniref:hypothetical protein n=1 Tax=Paractinoplanes brasiliensis TaxID=52695 RepID=UPI001EF3A347|nr:hypothetical protein [Actinoplanes brasiliensis]